MLTLLAALLLPAPVSITPPVTWLDDGREVTATPRIDGTLDLTWIDGRHTTATVDVHAIVGANDPATLQALGLVVDRILLENPPLALVHDPRFPDGARLAQHLRTAVERGVLRVAVPDLRIPHQLFAARTPNDPRFGGQWFFNRLKMTEAWGLHWGTADSTIVVVDTGCDADHPDLKAKMDPGRDVVDRDDDPSPDLQWHGSAHGTACAGLVGASTDNNLGVAGACPGCRVRCVRLLVKDGQSVPLSADVDAFAFAQSVGASVVSNSWGFTEAIPVPQPLREAIESAFDHSRNEKGAVIVFASGNDDREVKSDEMLGVRGVLGVGAITLYEERTSYSNYGAPIDLAAPVGTLTTDITGTNGDDPSDYTANFGGTSSACPVVAGIAGLVSSAAPDLTADEVESVIMASAKPALYAEPDDQGHDKYFGFGIVDPVHALKQVLPVETVPDAGTPEDAGDSTPGGGGETGGCGCGGGAISAAALLALRGRRQKS